MVQRAVVNKAKRVAGKFAPVRGQIVAPGHLRLHAKGAHGRKHHAQLPLYIVFSARQKKGKIQVAQIVEHRSAAGRTARQRNVVAFHSGDVALAPGILPRADDHRVVILPQHQPCLARGHGFGEERFQRQVAVRIMPLCHKYRRALDHQNQPASMAIMSSGRKAAVRIVVKTMPPAA